MYMQEQGGLSEDEVLVVKDEGEGGKAGEPEVISTADTPPAEGDEPQATEAGTDASTGQVGGGDPAEAGAGGQGPLEELDTELTDELQGSIPQLTQETFLQHIDEGRDFLLQKEGSLNTLYEKMEKNKDNVQLFLEDAQTFDFQYAETVDKIESVGTQLNFFESKHQKEEIKHLYEKIDSLLAIQQRIDLIHQKKELVFVAHTGLGEALKSQSIEDAKNKIREKIGVDVTAEKAEKINRQLEDALNFTSVSIDALIKLNEGSSVETFLSFLIDPVGTRGRDGLSFGTSEFDGVSYENVPLPLFRELLSNPRAVGAALESSIKRINETWAGSNGELLQKIKDLKDDDKGSLKDLLVKMTKELFIDSGESDKNKQAFRREFGSALMGEKDKKFYLDDKSMLFFIEQIQDDGEKLAKLWNIPA